MKMIPPLNIHGPDIDSQDDIRRMNTPGEDTAVAHAQVLPQSVIDVEKRKHLEMDLEDISILIARELSAHDNIITPELRALWIRRDELILQHITKLPLPPEALPDTK